MSTKDDTTTTTDADGRADADERAEAERQQAERDARADTTTTDDDTTTTDDDSELGRLRTENARWRKEARDWKRKAETATVERDAATQTADERLQRLEAAERRSARATIDRLAQTAGFHAGEPAHEYDALVELLSGDDDGEAKVAERLKAVAKERPYLVAQRDGRVLTPGRQTDVDQAVADKDAWLRT